MLSAKLSTLAVLPAGRCVKHLYFTSAEGVSLLRPQFIKLHSLISIFRARLEENLVEASCHRFSLDPNAIETTTLKIEWRVRGTISQIDYSPYLAIQLSFKKNARLIEALSASFPTTDQTSGSAFLMNRQTDAVFSVFVRSYEELDCILCLLDWAQESGYLYMDVCVKFASNTLTTAPVPRANINTYTVDVKYGYEPVIDALRSNNSYREASNTKGERVVDLVCCAKYTSFHFEPFRFLVKRKSITFL